MLTHWPADPTSATKIRGNNLTKRNRQKGEQGEGRRVKMNDHIRQCKGKRRTFFLPLLLDEDWAASSLAALDFCALGGILVVLSLI